MQEIIEVLWGFQRVPDADSIKTVSVYGKSGLETVKFVKYGYSRPHQEIGETLVWPDSYDQSKSGWYCMIFPYI